MQESAGSLLWHKDRLSLYGESMVTWLGVVITTMRTSARTLLDVVVSEGAAVLKLLTGKDQTLLIRGDACLVAKAELVHTKLAIYSL